MDISDIASEEAQPVAEAIRDQLLESFIAATCAALSEMADTDVGVRATQRTKIPAALGDIRAVVGLESTVVRTLVLSFPKQTAACLAEKILAGAAAEVDENLIRDCVGEIGNVVAGQAKALLAGTPCRFAFSLPTVLVDSCAFHPQEELDCLVVAFTSDQGDFALQLFLKRSDVRW